jgi:hypothetical protein
MTDRTFITTEWRFFIWTVFILLTGFAIGKLT